MTQEANAAPVAEEAPLLDPLSGQEVVNDDAPAAPVDSAPTEDAPVAEPAKEDGFQKRINKVTADKYAEKRRADELERKLKELEGNKPPEAAPTLEGHDFDEEAYRAALIQYEVKQAVNGQAKSQKEAAQQVEREQSLAKFNDSVAALGKEDFSEVASAVPLLPEGVADALMQSDGGAEVIYHLGTHLDVADRIANMSPATAMLELGKISASMASQPKIETSAAPEPIAPLKSGSSLPDDVGADIPIDEWMRKHNA